MGAIRDLFVGQSDPLMIDSGGVGTSMAAVPIGRGVAQIAEAQQRNSYATASNHEVWDIYDQIGEVRNAVAKQARVAGHGKMGVFRIGADGRKTKLKRGDTVPPAVAEVHAALQSPQVGQRGLIQRFHELYKIAGFMEVQAYKSGNTITGINLRSADEIDRTGDGKAPRLVRHPRGQLRTWASGTPGDLTTEGDPITIIGQIWQPHPRYFDLPVSSLYSMRSTCNQLITLQNSILQRLQQRAAMAGIHFFPKNLTNVHVPESAPDEIKNARSGLAKIAYNLQQSIKNPHSPESLVGVLISGDPDDIKGYRYEDAFRALLESDIMLAEKLLGRIINGLDAQQGAVVGRTEANHFSAWADDAEEMRSNIIPGLEDFCYALSSIMLWPRLTADETAEYAVWYDMTDSQTTVNRGANVKAAVEAGEVSRTVLGDVAGANDDERMKTDEAIRRIGEKNNDPWLSLYGLEDVPPEVMEHAKKISEKSKTGPAGNIAGDERNPSQPGDGEPGSPSDDRSDRPGSDAPVD